MELKAASQVEAVAAAPTVTRVYFLNEDDDDDGDADYHGDDDPFRVLIICLQPGRPQGSRPAWGVLQEWREHERLLMKLTMTTMAVIMNIILMMIMMMNMMIMKLLRMQS